jgi:hypothetical protein
VSGSVAFGVAGSDATLSHVSLWSRGHRPNAAERGGTCYQSALTPEIRTLLRQYRLVDEQVYGSPSLQHHVFSAMTSSTSVVAGAAETGVHHRHFGRSHWTISDKDPKRSSQGPFRSNALCRCRGRSSQYCRNFLRNGLVRVGESVQMECFCGAWEIFLPSQPSARFVRLVVIPCAVLPDEHASEPLRQCDPVGCERGAIDSTVVGLHSTTTTSTRESLETEPSETNESTKLSAAPCPDEPGQSQESNCYSKLDSPILDECVEKLPHLACAEDTFTAGWNQLQAAGQGKI